jgi:hypothetical protein
MITKMSGEGTGGTPRRPIALRLLTSIGTAVLVVLVVSRVNRPTGIHARPSATSRAVEGRLYDVRDILANAQRWEKPLRPDKAAQLSTMQQRGVISGMNYAYGADDSTASEVASMMESLLRDPGVNSPASAQASAWAGWVHVRATPYEHRHVELFLRLLRRGDSHPALQIGARR